MVLKIIVFIVATMLSLGIALSFNHSVTEEGVSQDSVEALLKDEFTSEKAEFYIETAFEQGDIELASEFLWLSETMNLAVSQNLKKEVVDADSVLNSGYRNTVDFLGGFATGGGDSMASLSGSVVSDFTIVGDVRDLSIEASHYASGEPVDELIAGLSAVGIALSAGTLFSLGSAAAITVPTKLSLSLTKYAVKTSRLTKQFRRYLADVLDRSVSLEPIYKKISALKSPSGWGLNTLGELEAVAKQNIHLEEISKIGARISNLRVASGGAKNTVHLLSYVETGQDLKNVETFAMIYGKRSVAVLKVLGKKALRVTKFSVKHFVELLMMILAGVYSLLSLLLSEFFSKRLRWFFAKKG